MDSEMPSFHIWSHLHQVPSAACGIRYIVYPGLASCPFYEIPIPLRLITPEPEGNYQLQTSDDYKVKSCIYISEYTVKLWFTYVKERP